MSINYSPTMGTPKTFALTSVQSQWADVNENRAVVVIQNQGTNPLYIGFGPAANAAVGLGLLLAAGDMFAPDIVPQDAIWLASSTGATAGVLFQI